MTTCVTARSWICEPALWQPRLESANPDPYTHQMTPPTTPCVTARSWICEPWPLHPPDDTSNDTLCDSPVLDLRTLTPTHTTQHLQRHPVWQPGLGSANPDPYTHHTTPPTTPCVTARSWICEPWPLHPPDDTSNDTLCDSPHRNEPTKSANPHPPTWSKNPYS